MKDNKRIVNSLSVISSSVCNLNCSFCYLHKNQSYKIFDEMCHKAWLDGSYLDNMFKSLQALNVDMEEVKTIQLWGGETLLHIDDITFNVKQFYEYWPNINNWKISSNWLVDIKKVVNFIKEIDKYTKQPCDFDLQLSIDGPPGPITETGHNGDWETYRKNIEDFTYLINNTKLYKTIINITINATVNKDLYLKEFSTYEGIKSYIEYMRNFTKYIEEKCISRNLELKTIYVLPGCALPYSATTEEGLELSRICKLAEYVIQHDFPDCNIPFFYGIGQLDKEKNLFSPNVECSEYKGSLTFIPDGTIVECSGSYIYGFEKYQEELAKKGENKELNLAKRSSYNFYCPKDMTEEELEIADWKITNGYKGNSSTYMAMMLAMADELALSGQIPYYYHTNHELALKHLSVMSNLTSCTRENMRDTCIPYLTDPSCFRRYLNGVIQDAYLNYILQYTKDED